jgi:hypothetical protein
MFQIVRQDTRPDKATPFYKPDTPNEVVQALMDQTGFKAEHEISANGLVRTSTFSWNSREDFESFVYSDAVVEESALRDSYNNVANIKSIVSSIGRLV